MAEYEDDDTSESPAQAEKMPGADDGEKASPAEQALIRAWEEKIVAGRKHYEKVFKQMRKNQEFARYGSERKWKEAGNYTVPILARHINSEVARLYARNPKSVASRRKRMMHKLWDGRNDSLQAAMQLAQMGNPTAMQLIEEVMAVEQSNLMLDRMGETMTLLWQYFLDEQGSNYKQQLKAAVRRAKVCKVGWIKLGFQRLMEPRPDKTATIADATSKIVNMKDAADDAKEGELEPDSAEAAQLAANLRDMQADSQVVMREGPVLSFPRATQIMVDPACFHLKTLSGACWMAEEFEMKPCDIEKTYGVDIGTNFKAYAKDGRVDENKGKDCSARVYQIWDKENLQVLTICEGYDGWLKAPATPTEWLERFWPYFPIVFNEAEDDRDIYPQSDIEQGEHIQKEYNRIREALREHRIAAKPYYVVGKMLDDKEKDKLANHGAHEIFEMPSLAAGQRIDEMIQRGPVANIDPNLYETEATYNDMMRALGSNEAQYGGMSNGTATESSIAEQSMSTQRADNVDDLDEVLTELFRAAGQLLLLNMTKEQVIEIVGPGAVWPDAPQTRQEAAAEIYLEMEAGSSGRPNRAAELANLERAMPYLQQVPNINPEPLVKKYAPLLDIDPQELYAGGMPSMTALNAMMAKMAAGPGGGAPEAQMQGAEGATNAPSTQQNEPGPQPQYTAPGAPA